MPGSPQQEGCPSSRTFLFFFFEQCVYKVDRVSLGARVTLSERLGYASATVNLPALSTFC